MSLNRFSTYSFICGLGICYVFHKCAFTHSQEISVNKEEKILYLQEKPKCPEISNELHDSCVVKGAVCFCLRLLLCFFSFDNLAALISWLLKYN